MFEYFYKICISQLSNLTGLPDNIYIKKKNELSIKNVEM